MPKIIDYLNRSFISHDRNCKAAVAEASGSTTAHVSTVSAYISLQSEFDALWNLQPKNRCLKYGDG